MYTSLNRQYPDLLRAWYKKSLQGVTRCDPQGQTSSSKHTTRAATASTTINAAAGGGGEATADMTEYNVNSVPEFPPYADPTEEQEVCIDPIKALNIPRSRFHTIKEFTLCRKGITRLHPNVQLLKNLDTLIIRHNRLCEISFLIPPRSPCDSSSSSAATASKHKQGSSIDDIPHNTTSGCRLLRRLYASHNCIQTLAGDVCNLRHLEVLLLAHNRLSNLSAVSAQLKPLQCLRELDLRGNPLCDEVGYRLFLIHEHPHLEVLDRRAVRDEERKEAAAYFATGNSAASRHPVHGGHSAVSGGGGRGRSMASTHTEVKWKAQGTAAAAVNTTINTNAVQIFSSAERGEEEGEVMDATKGNPRNPGAASPREGPQQVGLRMPTGLLASQQQMHGGDVVASSCSTGGTHRNKEKGESTVVFLGTYLPEINESGGGASSQRGLFKPSACERLLEERVRHDQEMKNQRTRREIRAHDAAQKELQDTYQAFHATWEMSRRGMPLSSERWEVIVKAMDALPQSTASTDTPPVPTQQQQRGSVHRRSISVRQQASEQAAKARSNAASFSIDVSRDQLPQLPPPTAGHSDHSLLYDALLGRSDVVEMRIGQNHLCLPEKRRLTRMNNMLDKVTDLLHQPPVVSSGRTTQGMLLRDIQRNKDALVPEPWERMSLNGLTTTMNSAEQMEYLYLMAMSLFLPTEFSALEGHFMSNTVDLLHAQDTQRGKKQTKKDKSKQAESARLLPNAAASPLVAAAAGLQQRLPGALTATTVEAGPLERTTFQQVMNMLDVESGVWNLNLDSITEAFREEYDKKAKTNVTDTDVASATKKDDKRLSFILKRTRRSFVKTRTKNERHGATGKCASIVAATSIPPQRTSSWKVVAPTLHLNTVLLDMVRYLPFVENRLAFFRQKCKETASKGEGGASAEAAQGWFSKAQVASIHCERLLNALQMKGVTKDEALSRLVPLQSIAVRKVQEVGSFFR